MTLKQPRGTFLRKHDCGWSGTFAHAGIADYAMSRHSCERWLTRRARTERHLAELAKIDRTPKACHHPLADHQHGTYACYVQDGCRCPACAAARATWDSDRARQKAYGRWNNLVDAEPARQHVKALMAQGMGLKQIIAVGATTSGQIWKLVYGKADAAGVRRPTRRVKREVSERLLAVQLDLAPGAAQANFGATRRLRALVALGYSQAELARRLGVTDNTVGRIVRAQHTILTSNVAAIAELYDQLSMTPPPERTHRERVVASRARGQAKARGWKPPLAIDDETLDDDFEGGQIEVELDCSDLDEIAIERRMSGDRSVHLTRAEGQELRRRWYAQGRSGADLERICGMAPTTRLTESKEAC